MQNPPVISRDTKKKHCDICGGPMQRWGKTKAGTLRFFCVECGKSGTRKRKDLHQRHLVRELTNWLGGNDSLTSIANEAHKTRQALWKELHPLFQNVADPHIPDMIKVKMLILDATYVHGHSLCALIAIDENDKIYWKFAPYESYASWLQLMSHFREPEIVVMDGQKGLFASARMLWPTVPIQRCQFHVIAFAMTYIGRRPREEAGRDLMNILYGLKYTKTCASRDAWLTLYRFWEKKYEMLLGQKNDRGGFQYPRLRSARYVIRRAMPNLFTFLDHPGSPNTTNLVEGWINSAIAEALRDHRGLRLKEKKMLVSIILSKLKRGNESRV